MSAMRILVAEDERIVARVITDSLVRLGYQVAGVATRGEDVIAQALESPPDLILMDIRLQGKVDGIEAAARIRERADIPVVYLTAFADEAILARAKLTEPFGYILKPFEENELHAGVEMALYKHDLSVRLQESEARYRALSELTSDFAYSLIVKPEGGVRAEWVSAAFSRIVSLQPDEIMDRDWRTLLHPDDVPKLATAQRELLAGQVYREDLRIITRDGRILWLRNRTTPIWDKEHTRVVRVLGAAQDVTQERAAEEQVLLSAARAQALAKTASRLNAQVGVQQVLDTICEQAMEALDAAAVNVILFDEEGGALSFAASRGMPMDQSTDFDCLSVGKYLRAFGESDRTIVLPDILAIPELASVEVYARLGIRTVASARMMRQGELMGSLNVLSLVTPREWNEGDLELLQGLADEAATALEKARLYEQVRSSRERLQALSNRLVEVQEAERRHVARELHDEIGQSLTGLRLLLEMSQRLPVETVRARLGDAQAQVDHLMEQVQNLSLDLRPTMLDDLGLLPALLWLIKRYTDQTSIAVSFEHSGLDGRASPAVETAAYRIVQEALTNAARYAGVTEVSARVWVRDGRLHLQVEDLGKGFEAEALMAGGRASGLTGMRERASLVGGRLSIVSNPGAGTSIIAELPFGGHAQIERRFSPR
jgi:PAS domain S-box-containing protein